MADASGAYIHTWDGASWARAGHLHSPGVSAATAALPPGARSGAEALAAAVSAASAEETDGQPRVLPRVAVLGLSPLGVAIAKRLHQLGFNVIVYDARPHAGALEIDGLRRVTRARTARHAAALVSADGGAARSRRRRLALGDSDAESPSGAELPQLPPPVLVLAVETEEALRSLLDRVWSGDTKHVPLGTAGSASSPVNSALGVGVDKRLFPAGTVALCLAALTPATAAAAAAAALKRRVMYVHAALGGATPAACLAGGLWMYVGGPSEALARASPVVNALALGVTVLGASPAVACSPSLIQQMEGLRRSALAMAVANGGVPAPSSGHQQQSVLRSAAPPSVSVAQHEAALAALRAEQHSQVEAMRAAQAQEVSSLRSELARIRRDAAAVSSKREEMHATMLEALEASQTAGLDALAQANAAVRDRDAERAFREAQAREAASQLSVAHAKTRQLEEQLAAAERVRSAASAEAAVWEERCSHAEQQVEAVSAECEARLSAARAAMSALEVRLLEERRRTADGATTVETQLVAFRASAAAAVADMRTRLVAAQASAAAAETARDAALQSVDAAQREAGDLRNRVEQLEAQRHAAEARSVAAEGRVDVLTARLADMQTRLDDALTADARRKARAVGGEDLGGTRKQGAAPLSRPPWSPGGAVASRLQAAAT